MSTLLVTSALTAGLLAGCGGESSAASVSAPDKYKQTWDRPYSETTCADLATSMNAHQRWAAAADMLVGARNKDGGTDMPSDELVTEFLGELDQGCAVDTMSIAEAGAMTYLMNRAEYQPTP